MTYTLTNSGSVVRDADGAVIPADPAVAEWRTYQAWLAAGNTPNPAPLPPAAVPSCKLWQLRSVMSATQWTAVQAAVAALNEAAVAAFAADGDDLIPANSKTLLALGAAIGLSAAQVTALVQQAAEVQIP